MDHKYLWKKKQDYISKVESDCLYLYQGKESTFLSFYSSYSVNKDNIERFLFTEKEANEILGNTFYMFERIEIDVQDDTAL